MAGPSRNARSEGVLDEGEERVQVQMYVCDEEAQNELVFLRIITYHVLSVSSSSCM